MSGGGGIFPYTNTITNKNTLKENVANVVEKNFIDSLSTISPIMFTSDFINILFKIYSTDEFTLSNAILFSELMKCNVFVDFAKSDDEEKAVNFERVLNIYFNALAGTRPNINAVAMKHKICSLLKMKIKIPSFKNGISLKHINVNISTTYKPSETACITAACDIVNVVKDFFLNSTERSTVENFAFTPHLSTVVMNGPILKNVISSMMNMQSQMIQNGIPFGVQVQPFIDNVGQKIF
ncbi:hypothetical protein PvNV_085 [Penaeus vannamei nudivirus]|nr:hypothetical protein PvSNPV_085 [Penaeus vannamei nucleopolyhedrovirus]